MQIKFGRLLLILSASTFSFSSTAAQPNSINEAAERIAKEFLQTKFEMPAESTSLLAEEYRKKWGGSGREALTPAEIKRFLGARKDVPVNHPLIKDLVSLIVRESENDFQKLVSIHNFVLWRLTYVAYFMDPYKSSESMSSWKGQTYACMNEKLKNGSYRRIEGGYYRNLQECAIPKDASIWRSNVLLELFSGADNCSGYAYLFATLARAAGVPTRIVREPSTDSGVGHYWNQVFINGQWLVVDTTFDDLFDEGKYQPNSSMRLDFTYFLISPQTASQLDPKHHGRYKSDRN